LYVNKSLARDDFLTCINFKIEFADGDTRDPINFPATKKWRITIMACVFALFAGMFSTVPQVAVLQDLIIGPGVTASTYNTGFTSMTRDLNCTRYQANIGLALFALGFGVLPLVSSSLSEELGRQPLYIVSALGFFLMFLMIALYVSRFGSVSPQG